MNDMPTAALSGLISASVVAVIVLGTLLLLIYRAKSRIVVPRPSGCVCRQGCIRPGVCSRFKSQRCAMRAWKESPRIAMFSWLAFFPVFVFAGIVNGMAAPSRMRSEFGSTVSYWRNLRPKPGELD